MHLEGAPTVMDFDPFQQQQAGAVTGPVTGSQFQYATMHHPGEQVRLADGRYFRYALVGASNLVAGTLNQAPAEKANHYEINPTSAVTSFTTVNSFNLTIGNTAVVANEYNEGFLTFSSGNNVGLTYQISYTPAALASATTFAPTLYDFLQNSVATSDTVDLSHNQWNNIIQSPGSSDQTIRNAGVCMIAATAAYGAWVVSHGLAACVADGTVAVGTQVVASNSTAGAVTGMSTTFSTAVAQIPVGYCGLQSAIATNSKPIVLMID